MAGLYLKTAAQPYNRDTPGSKIKKSGHDKGGGSSKMPTAHKGRGGPGYSKSAGSYGRGNGYKAMYGAKRKTPGMD